MSNACPEIRKRILTLLLTIFVMLTTSKSATCELIRMHSSGCDIAIELPAHEFDLPADAFRSWIERAALATKTYYRVFPAKKLLVHIQPREGDEVGVGFTSFDDGQAVIELSVGKHVTKKSLDEDWTATHEMTHLAFPLVERENRWVAEGMASYVEPIGRMQCGQIDARAVWREFTTNMHRGAAIDEQELLSKPRSWDRMYWGGATFFLLADIEIRKQSNNKMGLQDALAGIVVKDGTIASDLDVEEALQIADRAIHSKVLETMYEQWKAHNKTVDLNKIWTSLGIERTVEGKVILLDAGPAAALRHAIENGNSSRRND